MENLLSKIYYEEQKFTKWRTYNTCAYACTVQANMHDELFDFFTPIEFKNWMLPRSWGLQDLYESPFWGDFADFNSILQKKGRFQIRPIYNKNFQNHGNLENRFTVARITWNFDEFKLLSSNFQDDVHFKSCELISVILQMAFHRTQRWFNLTEVFILFYRYERTNIIAKIYRPIHHHPHLYLIYKFPLASYGTIYNMIKCNNPNDKWI